MSEVDLWEVYLSIQGEGRSTGRPCVLVRLSGCNLSCNYCDTTDAAKGTGERVSVESIVDRVKKFDVRLVEVTGGEPLIRPGAKSLVSALADEGFEILVETNGTVDISLFDRRASYIVDIKTPGSGAGQIFLKSNFLCLTKRDEIKFVITSRDDFDWSVDSCRKQGLTEKSSVLFSPAWGVVDPRDLVEWLLESGLDARLSLQTHKYIWGANAEKV